MKRFLCYFCMYCVSRLLFFAVRGGLRSASKPCKAGQPCDRHVFGIFLFAAPFGAALFFVCFYQWILAH